MVNPETRRVPVRPATILTALLLASASAAPALPPAPTLDNPDPRAVSGVDAARRFFALAQSRRVDVLHIGDSNARSQAVSGHEDALGRALAERLGMYASRLAPVFAIYGNGAGVLSESSGANPPFQAVTGLSGLPGADLAFPTLAMPQAFAWLPAGETVPYWYNSGLGIAPDHPLGIDGPLRYHLTELVQQPGVGSFVLEARPSWPGNAYAPQVTRVLGADQRATAGVQHRTLDLPAGPRPSTGLLLSVASLAQQFSPTGPLLLTYARAERPDKTAGIAISPLWQQGGQSAHTLMQELVAFQNMPGPTRFYLQQATRLHNGPPALLVIIQHGGNDLNQDAPSLGPVGGFPSSSPQGVRDNFQGIINWVRANWVALGYDPANLYFMLGPYHPRGAAEDIQLGYAQQWADMAATDPQIFSVNGLALTTSTQLVQRGWLAGGNDPYHLSVEGFRAMGRATVRALSLAVCPGDYTADGALTLDDLFVFLADWFALAPRADADFSGAIAIDDIFVFLDRWFAGCD